MEIDVNENGDIELRKVFNPIVFKSSNNEVLTVCMRDGGFEFNYEGTMYSAQKGIVESFELMRSKIKTISDEQVNNVTNK